MFFTLNILYWASCQQWESWLKIKCLLSIISYTALVKPKRVGTHTQLLSHSMCLIVYFFEWTSSSSLKSKFITSPAFWRRDCLCPWLPTLVNSTIVILFFYAHVMYNIIWSAMCIICYWMTFIANILWLSILFITESINSKSWVDSWCILCAQFWSVKHSFWLFKSLSLFTHSQWKFRLITMYIHFIVLHYFFKLKWKN